MLKDYLNSKMTMEQIEAYASSFGRPDRMPLMQVEELIEKEIEECGGIDNLLNWEIDEIRENFFTSNGWYEDPFPTELPEEDDDEDEDEDDEPSWHTLDMKARLAQVGMSWADFM